MVVSNTWRLLCLAALAVVAGCGGVPRTFQTQGDLEGWAGSSSRLGGRCEHIQVRGENVVVAYRDLASGRYVTEVSVFVQDVPIWRLVSTHGPVRDAAIEMQRQADCRVFRDRVDKRVLFTVPFTAFEPKGS